jgi:hypothetical protein
MGVMMKRFAPILILCLSGIAMAAEGPGTPAEHAVDNQPHPTISHNSDWAGIMIIVIVALFVMAAVIGPVVRAFAPPTAPDPGHGDDSHGAHDHAHDSHAQDHGHAHGH